MKVYSYRNSQHFYNYSISPTITAFSMQPGPGLGPITSIVCFTQHQGTYFILLTLTPLSNGFPPPGVFHGQPRLTMSNFRRLKINHRLPFREKKYFLMHLKNVWPIYQRSSWQSNKKTIFKSLHLRKSRLDDR